MSKVYNKDFCNELLTDTCNVYRTENYIVKQDIAITTDEDTAISKSVSCDTYYLRTLERDRDYEYIFEFRGKKIDGKRIRVAMYTREYIE